MPAGTAAPPDITLILFDLNGVLYTYDRAARIGRLAALCGVTPAFVEAAIWTSGFEDSGDAGLEAEAYLIGFGERLGCDLSEADWLAAQQAAIAPIPSTLALVERLRDDVAGAVLTNNNLLIRRHFAQLYPEAAGRLGSRAHVSAEFGCRKPDPEVYRRCLAALGVSPAAALFIDDAPANVAGAADAGLNALLYTHPANLEAELRARKLLAGDP